jgi:hypothetical protein
MKRAGARLTMSDTKFRTSDQPHDDDDYDDDVAEEVEAVSPSPVPPSIRIPLRLNRNLMNFPLARSARTVLNWNLVKGEWTAELYRARKGGSIDLLLPGDTPAAERRCPLGFDTNAVFRLLAEVQRPDADPNKVEFASLTAFLCELGFTGSGKNNSPERIRLKDALWLAMVLKTRWNECWYVPGPRGELGEKITRTLPPPIRDVEYRGQRVIITLDPQWVLLANANYWKRVPALLPNEASLQNIILFERTTSLADYRNAEGQEIKHFWRGTLAAKIGVKINKLASVAARARLWYLSHGGDLAWSRSKAKGKVAFVVTPPKIPRVKRKPKPRDPDLVALAMARAILNSPALNEKERKFVNAMMRKAAAKKRAMTPAQWKWFSGLFSKCAPEGELERIKEEIKAGVGRDETRVRKRG